MVDFIRDRNPGIQFKHQNRKWYWIINNWIIEQTEAELDIIEQEQINVNQNCSRHEGPGPVGLPKSIEEVWKKSWIVIYVMYICVTIVNEMWHGHIIYLCTRVKLSSCQGRVHVWNMNRWDTHQDTGWDKANKEDTCRRELARGSVWPEDEAKMDVFARCSKKVAAQVCTKYMVT
jgi:hypothetical protein